MKIYLNKGFTLIEVLIGLSISGVVVASLLKALSMSTQTVENIENKETLQRAYFTILGEITSRGFAPMPLSGKEQYSNINVIYKKGNFPFSIDGQITNETVIYEVDKEILSTAGNSSYYDPGNLIKKI